MRRTRVLRVGELLGDFFKEPAIARKIAEGRLPEAWACVAGPVAQSVTLGVEFKNGIMTVRISSSVIRSEVFMRRGELKDEINQKLGVVLVRELIVK